MKVALSIEVTDEQRKQLSSLIAGKAVVRLATREEVREFVNGALATLSSADVPQSNSSPRGGDEEVAAKLRAEGKSESYIRGWLSVGRVSA
jgi:hypothetical protein